MGPSPGLHMLLKPKNHPGAAASKPGNTKQSISTNTRRCQRPVGRTSARGQRNKANRLIFMGIHIRYSHQRSSYLSAVFAAQPIANKQNRPKPRINTMSRRQTWWNFRCAVSDLFWLFLEIISLLLFVLMLCFAVFTCLNYYDVLLPELCLQIPKIVPGEHDKPVDRGGDNGQRDVRHFAHPAQGLHGGVKPASAVW